MRTMRFSTSLIEASLLVLLVLTGWFRIEADRENPPEPFESRSATEIFLEAEKRYMAGEIPEAVRLYWHTIKLDPDQIDARFRLASIYQSPIHAWDNDALRLVDEILSRDPEHVGAHLLKGKILRNQGEPQRAMEAYLHVVEADPQNAEAHYHLGTSYEAKQQWEQAIEHYQAAIRGDPELQPPPFESVAFGLKARLQLARVLRRQQDFEEATRLIEEALSLDPHYSEARSELVSLLNAQAAMLIREHADPGTQLAIYRKITQVDPEDPVAWYRMGQIQENFLHQPEEAMASYQRAYELDPTYTDALLSLRALELERTAPTEGN